MRVLVFGRGKSGLGAAKLLERLGIEPLLYSDGEPEPELSGIAAVVKSPGVPPRNPLLEKAKRAGIPVYGEVELGYRFSSGSFISVTGTNGKSTTTAVIYHALKLSGRESFIGGNYGIPLSTFALDTTEESFTALELSSFQIEDLTSFRSRVSVFLNVTPDHLNRYSSFEEYREAKLRLLDFSDCAVVNGDDPSFKHLKGKPGIYTFSVSADSGTDARVEGELLVFGDYRIPYRELPLKGIHNLENYLAALVALAVVGLSEEEIYEGFKAFKGLPHRCEVVGRKGGVVFVNDSKATNPDAMKKALESFRSVVLIAGGSDKGLDFKELKPLVKSRVKALVAIGETAGKLVETFREETYVLTASSMEEAVERAYALAGDEGVVLLSPGCASFDMFKNFQERGERFREAVKRLTEET